MTIDHMTDVERLNWLRLFRSENVGPMTFQRLLQRFGTVEAALDALPDMARNSKAKRAPRIASLASAKAEMAQAKQFGARLIAYPEADYPPLLRNIPDPPPIISVIGRPELLQMPIVAIVGARNASNNGNRLARNIAHDLSHDQIVVASGLARGIDTSAHLGAGPSHTIAVLAGGIDNIYPRENQDLYDAIVNEGCIVSEMPFGTAPQARHFPRRNRIVSGLSLGTVVIEATIRSGSLITARLAAEQGREVMAVPGSPADSRASGPNSLIKDGASLVENASDILEIVHQLPLDPISPHFPEAPAQSEQSTFTLEPPKPHTSTQTHVQKQSKVLDALTSTPLEIDGLFRDCDLSAAEGSVILLELELTGQIERLPGQMIARIID